MTVLRRSSLALALSLVALAPIAAQRTPRRVYQQGGAIDDPMIPDIAFTKYVLPNGLTLIVHEDHKAPIVAVNVWYHVGSKNERPGRTGFAHLFEHLMFNGSEHFNDDYFKAVEPIGATDLNGTTSEDRTNYFQNVPVSALDRILWLESDRMGHLVGVIDSARLAEQRGVVQNEKRQGENQPYGKVWVTIPENTYPRGHPYSWSVIGSMEDLDAARLDDVKEWFRSYYGPANATIVVAGDVTPEAVRQKVLQNFGDIPSGPPLIRHDAWIAKMTGEHRQRIQDRVPQARIHKIWNVPGFGSPDGDYLQLVADILADGKSSRLYKRLVYTDRVATDVVGFIDAKEIGGQLMLWATAKPGQDVTAAERALDEEVAAFIARGPTPAELARVKTQYRARFVRGVERIGGFGGKSDVLAQNQVYLDDPAAYKQRLWRVANATAADLQGAAKRWLSDGVYALEVVPFAEMTTVASTIDRAKLPDPGNPPSVTFPTAQRGTLSNGMKVVLVSRDAVPVVGLDLLLDAGYAADQSARPGTATMVLKMLTEGTTTRGSTEIAEALESLGADVFAYSQLDVSHVRLSVLKDKLDAALDIYADVIRNPSFPERELARLRDNTIADIKQEKVDPFSMALRVVPALLYGDAHSYGTPLTGTGTEASVKAMTRDDLVKFHRTWFKPNHATILVVGSTTLAEITPKLERVFRGWQPGDIPRKNIAAVDAKPRSEVFLLDRPGAEQSVIIAAQLMPPKANPDELALQAFNEAYGGAFVSRINMNLREDKHWSYGAGSFTFDARGQRAWISYAPVQTDKTKESAQEMANELKAIAGPRPVTGDELTRVKDQQTRTLPGRWETGNAVRSSLAEMVTYGLPDDYYQTYAARVRALTTDAVTGVVRQQLRPEAMVWVVVGDRGKIERGIRELNLGELRSVDADGKIVTPPRGQMP